MGVDDDDGDGEGDKEDFRGENDDYNDGEADDDDCRDLESFSLVMMTKMMTVTRRMIFDEVEEEKDCGV